MANPQPNTELETTVELRAAKLPWIGWFAHHYYFVIEQSGQRQRWEVWQRANACATSIAHVHTNLLSADAGVGWGPSWCEQRWTGVTAANLANRLAQSGAHYPWCNTYHYWPGPNSNTYVQWMLGRTFTLPWRAIGRRYARRIQS